MWITILDYSTGEVIIEKIEDNLIEDWEGYVHEKIGHNSECHMVSDELILKINNK